VIALIDYKAGNLTSVKKALATIGADVLVPQTPADLADAAGIIVPGVGHFGATRALDSDWIEAILARVGEGRPLFGICLGMQWLFEGSDEAPDLPGLGLLAGRCYRLGTVRLKPDTTEETVQLKPDTTDGDDGNQDDSGSVRLQADRIKIPHVGWNSLTLQRETSIVDGVDDGSQVYFTHSYVAPVTGDTVAVTEHGEAFAAVVQRGYIGGVQFHPEKSGAVGLQILRNFVELAG
jgi:imidazole glycerol-phosphate synthase subunit HisH